MERQQELFNEFKPGVDGDKISRKAMLPEKALTLVLGYEKLILVLFGLLVILAVVFVFGFERGKKSVLARNKGVRPVAKVTKPTPLPASIKDEPKTGSRNERWAIQVATFKSEQLAQKEAERLKDKGFSTSIDKTKGGYYQVLAGDYSRSKDGSETLSVLRKIYKDCYIRKR